MVKSQNSFDKEIEKAKNKIKELKKLKAENEQKQFLQIGKLVYKLQSDLGLGENMNLDEVVNELKNMQKSKRDSKSSEKNLLHAEPVDDKNSEVHGVFSQMS